MNAYEIAAELYGATNGNAKASHYIEVGNSLVRVSDHMPNTSNIFAYNENVSRVLFIFTDSSVEADAENLCNDLCDKGIDAEYLIFENDEDMEYIKMKSDKFLAA